MPRKPHRSFIVRVVMDPHPRFVVHNLKTGEVKHFTHWEQLKHYLGQPHRPRLH